MYQFFISADNIRENEIIVDDAANVNHIRNVLRMKKGERVRLCCENGNEYICHITQFEDNLIHMSVEDMERECRELPVKITLFQGLAKGDKMDTIIQKAVELGAHEIVPVSTNRCVVKLDPKRAAKKVSRWNAISESAAKQSGRSYIPAVRDIMNYRDALSYASENLECNLIPYEEAKGMEETRKHLMNVKNYSSLGIFIGPEGGFEKNEVEQAMEIGAVPITLGHRILRTETAGMTVLSILMFLLESDQ